MLFFCIIAFLGASVHFLAICLYFFWHHNLRINKEMWMLEFHINIVYILIQNNSSHLRFVFIKIRNYCIINILTFCLYFVYNVYICLYCKIRKDMAYLCHIFILWYVINILTIILPVYSFNIICIIQIV